MKKGLLLINLGTPEASNAKAVRRFLWEFLADKRVITLPAFIRYLLLYCIILPFRTKKSTHAYQSIWTEQGSPLFINSINLTQKIKKYLGNTYKVALGMRYGQPSLESSISELKDCDELTILPLYPQYASSSTGSAIEEVIKILKTKTIFPTLHIIRDFHRHPNYIEAQVKLIHSYVENQDFILFSYHGIPEQHLSQAGCQNICQNICPIESVNCYRAQCFASTRYIAEALHLDSSRYMTVFQSRVGKNAWVKPYLTDCLQALFDKGIRRLVVVCPSFVADCLETLEEIGIRLKDQWLSMGGDSFSLVPSLNDKDHWVKAILSISNISEPLLIEA